MPVISRRDYQALLPATVSYGNLRQRRFRGYADRSVGRSDDLAIAMIAIRITEKLATRITARMAGELADQFFPMWSDALSIAETFPSEDPAQQIFLVVADVNGGFDAMIGALADAVRKLPGASRFTAISIHALLAELRSDAAARGVELPERLVPAYASEAYFKWRKPIDPPGKLARMRAALKGKTVVQGDPR